MPNRSASLVLNRLPPATRMLLAGLLAIAGLAFCVTALLAYFQVTPPNSLQPDFQALDGLFFGRQKPLSTLQRLLESSEGGMNRTGTMRPAFTEQSVGWDTLTQNMTGSEKASLLAEREGERLALLDWVRSGLSQAAYDKDDFHLEGALEAHPITEKYLFSDQPPASQDTARHVRIRSLVTDRCVTCHGENGRNEHARWIPLETYVDIERQSHPEATPVPQTTWLIVSLAALLPLACITGPLCYLTNAPYLTRSLLTLVPFVALATAAACWLLGQPVPYRIHLLLGAALAAAIGVVIQITASCASLFAKQQV